MAQEQQTQDKSPGMWRSLMRAIKPPQDAQQDMSDAEKERLRKEMQRRLREMQQNGGGSPRY